MKRFFQLCIVSFLCLGMSSQVSLAQCCGQALNPQYTPTGCGSFTICLPAYEDCPVTNIWTFGLPTLNWPRQGNCITLDGFQAGDNLNFHIMVGVTGCSNYFDSANYTVTDFGCGADPCCDAVIEAEEEATGECGEFSVCLTGLDLCDVTAIIPAYDSFANTATHTINGDCVVFSGLDIGATFNYSITVQIDGCDDVTVEGAYDVEDLGCDPCCLPPDINAVDIYQIPGWNWIRICMPEAPCPDQDGLLYGLSFLEQCDEEPGIYSITANSRECLYLRFRPCCTYTFSAGYRSDECQDVLWSQEVTWEAPCDEISGNGKSGLVVNDYEELPAELRQTLNIDAQVSPNPFKTDFQIQFSAQKAEAFELTIYNLQGKVINQTNGQLFEGENSISVRDLENLPAGSYFYQLNSENHHISGRAVKL